MITTRSVIKNDPNQDLRRSKVKNWKINLNDDKRLFQNNLISIQLNKYIPDTDENVTLPSH